LRRGVSASASQRVDRIGNLLDQVSATLGMVRAQPGGRRGHGVVTEPTRNVGRLLRAYPLTVVWLLFIMVMIAALMAWPEAS
jgi:hypothetical protein